MFLCPIDDGEPRTGDAARAEPMGVVGVVTALEDAHEPAAMGSGRAVEVTDDGELWTCGRNGDAPRAEGEETTTVRRGEWPRAAGVRGETARAVPITRTGERQRAAGGKGETAPRLAESGDTARTTFGVAPAPAEPMIVPPVCMAAHGMRTSALAAVTAARWTTAGVSAADATWEPVTNNF
mmetsp:Transcript_85757/g.276774  ORF Transcript_85757/g.276774 Transcript_85757/m.276774 type:complete len:181 (+) Transcript_85757:434-976(+)